MPDQLTFRLETDLLPDLPDLRPMEPRLLPEAFDSDEHLFEPWWGGVRAFAYVGPAMQPGDGAVRIVDAAGRGRVRGTPRIGRVGRSGGGTVGDPGRRAGRGGRHGPGGSARAGAATRRGGGPPGGVPGVRPAAPGRAVVAVAATRQATRGAPADPAPRRRGGRGTAIATEGKALFEAVAAQGVAGVLARQRMSPYFPGVRSRLWRFIPAVAAVGRARREGAEPLPPPTVATAPVLALISRPALSTTSRRRASSPCGPPR